MLFAEAPSFIATLGRIYSAETTAVDPDESLESVEPETPVEGAQVQQLLTAADA